ncbi:MAG TPA: hypothetical protein VGL58_13200 [Caulobacteraceae bacterium]|jgi:hypothetical protein
MCFRRIIILALAASVVAATASADPPPARSVDLTDGVSIADVRAIAADAGGEVERVKETGDNGFTVEMAFPGDNHPWFEGLECKGDGDARRCQEYEFGIALRARDAAQAKALERKLAFLYIAARADGDVLTFTRMDFTYGGVTREHLTESLRVILQIVHDNVDPVVWPETPKG